MFLKCIVNFWGGLCPQDLQWYVSFTSPSDSACAVCVMTYSFTRKVPILCSKQNRSGVWFKSVYYSNTLLCMNKHCGEISWIMALIIYIYIQFYYTCRVRFVHLNEWKVRWPSIDVHTLLETWTKWRCHQHAPWHNLSWMKDGLVTAFIHYSKHEHNRGGVINMHRVTIYYGWKWVTTTHTVVQSVKDESECPQHALWFN